MTVPPVGSGAHVRQADDLLEHGMRVRDPNWPWRGLHETEAHHPLMKGDSFRQFWKDRGFTNKDVENFTVDLDKDIHRAIEESGYWQNRVFEEIKKAERIRGRTLTKDEVLPIINRLLGELPKP